MSEKIVSRSVYLTIFTALMVLTVVTYFVAKIDLGPMNIVVALTIAVLKAVLVILYFMHLRYSTRLTQVVLVGGLFWLLIMFGITISDYLTRGWLAYGR